MKSIRGVSSLLVPTRNLQHEEGVVEDGYRFLEEVPCLR